MTTDKNKIKYGLKNLRKDRGNVTFAKLLYSYREAEGLSQVELAAKLGLSKGNICDFEKGRKIPSPAKAEAMAISLGDLPAYWVEVTMQDLLVQDELDYFVKIIPKKLA
ncbi:MAG: helix-turn-helix transcriptional regulator [Bacteriovorax sp.]|nr:helix-turn-helix transcriptional regulator [Bacteriovorax sp.]